MSLRRSRSEALALRSRQRQLSADLDQPFQDLIGHSPAMESVFKLVSKVAATEANVLIPRRYDPGSGEPDYNAEVTVEKFPG